MYYQNYEDYMRSVLGYPMDNKNTYNSYEEYESSIYEQPAYSDRNSEEIIQLYPEIYRIVNPMVQKICEANTQPITKELVNQMTDEIYLNLESNVEVDNIVNVRVNLPKEEASSNSKSRTQEVSKTNRNSSSSKLDNSVEEENRETRQRNRNPILQDLIRILILNRLFGGNFPGRPRPPHRPPFPGPGRPPRPPMRPPYPREYNNYFDF